MMTTLSDGSSRRYTLLIRRTTEDDAAYEEMTKTAPVGKEAFAQCIVSEGELGARVRCTFSTEECTVTTRRR